MQNDLNFIQEQADGSFLEKRIAPAANSLLAFDGSSQLGTLAQSTFVTAETDPAFAAWLASVVPAVPTSLTATVISSTRIDLAWDAMPGATGYRVYRDSTLIASPSTSAYSNIGLLASTEYSYTVAAINAFGVSSQCSAVAATTTAAITDTAVHFNGSGCHVVVPASTDWDLDGSFTIECWVKSSTAGDGQVLLGTWGNDNGTGWIVNTSNGTTSLSFNAHGINIGLTSGVSVVDGPWHHVEVDFDESTSTYYLFIDGILKSTASAGVMSASVHDLRIGCNGGQDSWSYFSGTIDEVRISNIARHTSGFSPATNLGTDTHTLGYWTFNEGTGTTAVDSSGNNHTGTLIGSVTWVDGCSI